MDITALDVQYEDVQVNGPAPEVTVTESSPMTTDPRVLGRDSPEAVRLSHSLCHYSSQYVATNALLHILYVRWTRKIYICSNYRELGAVYVYKLCG